ncbi:unnamed protein product [marine sediment metagenome]|uniref:Uncharacterized protein n=1 Tax=marine sediment metagenome TaxID=412755 RepID=X1NDY4_9ZZZZ
MSGSYSKTTARTANQTTVTANFHNSIMAEMKAVLAGVGTHNVSSVLTYTGGTGGDLFDTITITDNSPSSDAGFDITGVGTMSYNGSDHMTTFVYVFSASEMNVTYTATFTYTGENITTIGEVMS